MFAATATASELLIVGARRTSTGDLKDGVILREGAASASGWFVGGAQNDQLYAVATHGADLMAVGLTRSFRGALTKDQGMLVYHDGAAAPGAFAIGRYYLAIDQSIQLRAVAPYGNGWAIAGLYQDAARVLVVIAGAGGAPQRFVSIGVPGATVEVRVRRVVSAPGRVYVVGHAAAANIGVGFVVALDASNMAPLWARRFTAADSVTLRDALLDGATLRVVGALANDGLAIDLDIDSGESTNHRVLPGRALTSIADLAGARWVAGDTGSGAFAGVLESDDLRGVELASVEVSTLGPQSLVAQNAQPAIVVGKAGDALHMPLNAMPVAACRQASVGTPATTVATATSSVTNIAVTATTSTPALLFERPSGTTTTELSVTAGACPLL